MTQSFSRPLSLSQLQIYYDQSAWPQSSHFNVGGTGNIIGSFDVDIFLTALDKLIQDHAVLRTSLSNTGQQIIHDGWNGSLMEVLDLSNKPNAAEQAKTLCQQAFAITIPLQKGVRPWQFLLMKLAPEHHLIMARFHHVIMDGYSVALAFRELGNNYQRLQKQGHIQGKVQEQAYSAEVPEFDNFISASLDYKDSKAWGKDANWWLKQIPTISESLFQSNDISDMAPAKAFHQFYFVKREQYQDFSASAQQYNATTYHLYGAALVAYFAGIQQRSEVVIGVPVLNRGGKRFKNTLGMFAVLLPLKITVTPDMSMVELIQSIARKLKELYRHTRFPLHQIMNQIEQTNGGGNRLFDAILSYELHDFSVDFGDASLRRIQRAFASVTRYPLTFCICEFHKNDPIEIAIESSSNYLSEQETQKLGQRIQHIVEQTHRNPTQRICDIQLVTPQEALDIQYVSQNPYGLVGKQLSTDKQHSHGKHLSIDKQPTLLHRIVNNCQTAPEAIALKTNERQMNYADLLNNIESSASLLIELGVGKADPVAVILDRSIETIVLYLAISRIRAVYVPLDPNQPHSALNELVNESNSQLVIYSNGRSLSKCVVKQVDLSVFSIQSTKPLTQQEQNQLPPLPDAQDLLYILFTSGTSGRAKGVKVSHGALHSRITCLAKEFETTADDIVFQSIALTFDPAHIEIYLPLAYGSCCALSSPGQIAPKEILSQVNQYHATIMIFVPSILRNFLALLETGASTSLQKVICGGEQLPAQLAEELIKRLGVRLFNFYGPTEACIFASWFEYQTNASYSKIQSDSKIEAVPIGKPVTDTQLWVLDPFYRILPPGISGQLYIGGKGLADGYLCPDQTRASFVENHLVDALIVEDCHVKNNHVKEHNAAGQKLYKTGDVVFWNDSQQLCFVGRADRQIKLRGQRLEPDYIEQKIASLKAICLVAVDVRDEKLCAWVQLHSDLNKTTNKGLSFNKDDFRSQISEILLSQHIPECIFFTAEIPLLSSGKPDYANLLFENEISIDGHSQKDALQIDNLQKHDLQKKNVNESYQPPPITNKEQVTNTIISMLKQLWQDMLLHESINIDSRFSSLGGDSLQALNMLACIDEQFGIKITLSSFLQNDTIRLLATLIDKQQNAICINLSGHNSGKRVYIVASGHGDALRFKRLATSLGSRAHLILLQPPIEPDDEKLHSVQDMANLYYREIQTENYALPFCISGFSVGGVTALETTRVCLAHGLKVDDLVMLDTIYPGWLIRRTPLWKLILKWGDYWNKKASTSGKIQPRKLFTDKGLWSQVTALQSYDPQPMNVRVALVMTTSLGRWHRWLFRPWERIFSHDMRKFSVEGNHSSLFDASKVDTLKDILTST